MATVEPRRQRKKDGTLGAVHYRVRWRDPEGRARSLTFPKRRLADQWKTQVEHSMLAGTYINHIAGRETLEEYAERWRQARVWADGTGERVESVFRNHLYPKLGNRSIASIRPSDVQAWVAGLSKTLAPATVGVIHANLSGVMKAAVRDRVIANNPCTGTDLPRVPKTEIVPPTPDQVQRLAQLVPDQWRAAVAVGAGLGLRVSEMLALTVDRVDFLRREVRVDRQALPVKGGGIQFRPPKSEASYRTLPLPDSTSKALAAHIEQYGLGEHGAIFHGANGSLCRRQRVAEAVGSAITAANEAKVADEGEGLPEGLRYHDLRHFYASLLIAAGASVKTVQKRLGHASAVETLDTYGHLWPDNEEQTRGAVDAIMNPLVAYLCPTGSD